MGQSPYSQDELNGMTIAQIKALAADTGVAITKTKKADIIQEFLAQEG